MLFRYCIVYKLKFCSNSASSKSIGTIFPTAFPHFVSVFVHVGNSWNISKFSLLSCLLLNRLLRSRDITLLTKLHTVKAIIFPVVMCRYESWAIKKADRQRIDAFKLHWRRLLRVPGLWGDYTNQSERISTLNIHWKDWCRSSNTLATWCEELIYWKRSWCWGRLRAGGEEDRRERDG